MFKDFINGISYLLRPINIRNRNIKIKTFKDDKLSLMKDWEKIGTDTGRAIDKFKIFEQPENKNK